MKVSRCKNHVSLCALLFHRSGCTSLKPTIYLKSVFVLAQRHPLHSGKRNPLSPLFSFGRRRCFIWKHSLLFYFAVWKIPWRKHRFHYPFLPSCVGPNVCGAQLWVHSAENKVKPLALMYLEKHSFQNHLKERPPKNKRQEETLTTWNGWKKASTYNRHMWDGEVKKEEKKRKTNAKRENKSHSLSGWTLWTSGEKVAAKARGPPIPKSIRNKPINKQINHTTGSFVGDWKRKRNIVKREDGKEILQ